MVYLIKTFQNTDFLIYFENKIICGAVVCFTKGCIKEHISIPFGPSRMKTINSQMEIWGGGKVDLGIKT